MTPSRLAFVAVPHFAVRIELQRQPQLRGRPVVIGHTSTGAASYVADASEEALSHGIHTGLPLRHVHGLCPSASILTADISHYEQRFTALLERALTVVPALEPAELGAFYADVAGLERLYGGDAPLLRALTALLPARWRPVVGIGPNKFAAHMIALHGRGRLPVIDHTEARAFLANLSVESLPVEAALQKKLLQLGLQNLGDVAHLQTGVLTAQFGAEGRIMRELAHGRDPRPFTPYAIHEPFVERLTLASPSSEAEVFFAVLNQLVQRICARKERRGRSIRQLVIGARLAEGASWDRTLTFKEPASQADTLYAVLRARLDHIELSGPATELSLTVTDFGGPTGRPVSLFAWQGERLVALRESVARLKSRFGQSPLYRIVEVEPWSRIPERRYALIDFEP